MGCDIHAHVEIKVDGEWLHYLQPKIRRNYDLFSRLAGVRSNGSIKPISEPRGIPDDASKTTKFCFEQEDGHSDSWISSTEFYEEAWHLFHKHNDSVSVEQDGFGYLFGNGWNPEYKEDWPEGVEDYRFVFWFDS